MSRRTWFWILGLTLGGATLIIAAVAPCMLPSRMASNQNSAISTCREFAKAQAEYIKKDWNGDGVREYASTLRELAARGLIDAEIADAEGAAGKPYHGYRFKVLTSQGPGAAGGAKSFIENGHLIVNVALACVPEKWDVTGRDTFIVNTSGQWYQHDIEKATFPETYDPGGWAVGCD